MPRGYEDDDDQDDDRRRPARGRGDDRRGDRDDDGYDVVDDEDEDDDRGPRRGGGRDRPRRRQPAIAVPNYLVQAIMVTLCCCMPFGVVSIVYASQVDGKLRDGDVDGAMYASRNASKWAWIGFACGLVANLLGVIFGVLGGALDEMQRQQPY